MAPVPNTSPRSPVTVRCCVTNALSLTSDHRAKTSGSWEMILNILCIWEGEKDEQRKMPQELRGPQKIAEVSAKDGESQEQGP